MDPVGEAYVRAKAFYYDFFYLTPDSDHDVLVGERNPLHLWKGLLLTDGTKIFASRTLPEKYFFFEVSREGRQNVQFTLSIDGLWGIYTVDSYVTRAMFMDSDLYGSETDRRFKKLSPELVNWVGASIFTETLAPFPQHVAASLQEISAQLK